MKYFNKKRFTMRQVVGLLTVVFLGITVIAYAAVTVPNSFSTGTTISSSQVNANFTALGNAMPAVKTASFTNNPAFTSTTATSVGSITVTPPVDGYIILTGDAEVGINQSVADNNYVYVYLATTSTGTTNAAFFRGPSTTGPALPFHWTNLSITGSFPVTGGIATTFYITAARDGYGSNNVYVCANQGCRLTALFVPGTALP
ncbi:MAG: hypothetical protein HZA05_02780 [Nitrospirae bacterium]|nr:hypothetical protein [Nitrospirota bacterium]